MYESFIIIEDVGVMPDYAGNWPKHGVSKITTKWPVGTLSLGPLRIILTRQSEVDSYRVDVDYWDDAAMHPEHRTGNLGFLDVNEMMRRAEGCPVQLACNNISKAEFETHLEFETLLEIKFIRKP